MKRVWSIVLVLAMVLGLSFGSLMVTGENVYADDAEEDARYVVVGDCRFLIDEACDSVKAYYYDAAAKKVQTVDSVSDVPDAASRDWYAVLDYANGVADYYLNNFRSEHGIMTWSDGFEMRVHLSGKNCITGLIAENSPAALFNWEDLVLDGDGSLDINLNVNRQGNLYGIYANGDLKVNSGSYTINVASSDEETVIVGIEAENLYLGRGMKDFSLNASGKTETIGIRGEDKVTFDHGFTCKTYSEDNTAYSLAALGGATFNNDSAINLFAEAPKFVIGTQIGNVVAEPVPLSYIGKGDINVELVTSGGAFGFGCNGDMVLAGSGNIRVKGTAKKQFYGIECGTSMKISGDNNIYVECGQGTRNCFAYNVDQATGNIEISGRGSVNADVSKSEIGYGIFNNHGNVTISGDRTINLKSSLDGICVTYPEGLVKIDGNVALNIEAAGQGISAPNFGINPSKNPIIADSVKVNIKEGGKVHPILEKYHDLDMNKYYFSSVVWADQLGLLTGTGEGTFGIGQGCTRAEIVSMFWRLEGSPVVDFALQFKDVKGDADYAQAVAWAVSEGYLKGYSDNTFRPDQVVSRAQLVAFLGRMGGISETEPLEGYDVMYGGYKYNDVHEGQYFYNALVWATCNRFIYGRGHNTFAPNAICTREDVLTVLNRVFE